MKFFRTQHRTDLTLGHVAPVVDDIVWEGDQSQRIKAVCNGLLPRELLDEIEAHVIAVTWGCKHNRENQQQVPGR